MTEVNNLTNIARKIVAKLDAEDQKSDGKIEASIWNKFVCHKQGNEIRNYISTENALKSIITYIKREAAKTGQSIEDVANEWFGKLAGETDETQIDTKLNKTDNDLGISYIDIKSLIEPYGTDEYREKMEQTPEYFEKCKEKYAEVFDETCQLLLDVANNDYRYKITKGLKHEPERSIRGNYTAELADGRTIEISVGEWEGMNGGDEITIDTITIYDDKKRTSFSMQGDTLFITSGEDNGDIQGYKAEDKNNNLSNLATDIRKLVEKIFGEELKKEFGDNITYEW